LDLDALAILEGEDWVWQGASTSRPSHKRAIMRLSRGGSDACVLREFDLPGKCFIESGFYLPEAKGGVDWLDDETLLLSSAHGADSMQTRSGYARTVRLWQRGTDPLLALLLFESSSESVGVLAFVDRTVETERVWFVERLGFLEADFCIGNRQGPQTKLDLPKDASINATGDWLVVKTRTAWTVAGKTYAPGTLLGGSISALILGTPCFEVLFEESERVALQYSFWCSGRLILGILDNLEPQLVIFDPSASGWKREHIAGMPSTGVASAWPLDIEETESDGALIVSTQDPLTPPTLRLFAPDASPAILKRAPTVFSTDGLVVTRHEAISVDGVAIPYHQVGPTEETGDAPVLMSGYGGFGIARQAEYNGAVGKLWLERCGTHVVTHIRGGGEFGTRWHEAGRREGKKLSHDDFAAIAADLVRRGVTTPKRIAAMGGSNGGILITNMLTRYPDRFGALFCTIPLIDMRRYTRLSAGPSWIDEYGDPDKAEDWAFLKTYSAYHAVKSDQIYPPILIATSRRDDRVHPGHARKMAAKLQALGHEAYFYEPAAGGHSAGKDHREQATFIALGLGFLRQILDRKTH
jgi:prolyl oligopeptidase